MSLLQKILFGIKFDENPLQTMQCLLIIFKSDPITLERLSQIAGLALSTTSRITSTLSENEPPLISIRISECREKTIEITEYGKSTAKNFLGTHIDKVRN